MLSKAKLSAIRRKVRTDAHRKKREALGLPEPTKAERLARRLINDRYQAKLRERRQQEQQQQKAA